MDLIFQNLLSCQHQLFGISNACNSHVPQTQEFGKEAYNQAAAPSVTRLLQVAVIAKDRSHSATYASFHFNASGHTSGFCSVYVLSIALNLHSLQPK